jgi:hypothetical protein
VSKFLVEVYVPRADTARAAPGPDAVSRVADELTRAGRQVRLLRSILVPEDETCLYLFRAQSGDVVREAATRAGLRFEHVVEVEADWRRTDERTAFEQSDQERTDQGEQS